MTQKTKTGVAKRDFKDAGTGERFTKGQTVTLPEGQFANYAASGLVGTAKPKAPDPAPKA